MNWNNQATVLNLKMNFISDLRCIPLCVRRKLDLIGLKLKLQHWQEFNHDDKRKIVYWSDSIDDLDALKSYLISKTSRSRIGQAKENFNFKR